MVWLRETIVCIDRGMNSICIDCNGVHMCWFARNCVLCLPQNEERLYFTRNKVKLSGNQLITCVYGLNQIFNILIANLQWLLKKALA